jgi:linoleate 8R-lipoxygenase / 9,12-octadecadienoate 8-hydroperoxide 8R-isomerase
MLMSDRDDKWTQDLTRTILPGKDLAEVSWEELYAAFSMYLAADEDPSRRTLGNLTRGSDGTFDNASLINILTESTEDCAGILIQPWIGLIVAAFNSGIPKVLRVIEILGINRSRSWRTASLNEFRTFFGLPPYKSFEEINPDPQKAATLLHFYSHPDFVELYPAILMEDVKKTAGWLPSPTVTRALFSDLLGVLRGDRFYTQVISSRSTVLIIGLYTRCLDILGIQCCDI